MGLKVFHENEWREYPAKSYEEYTYAWLGEPHASMSVKLDGNGNEIAWNLVHDPALVNQGFVYGNRVDGVITQEQSVSTNNLVPSIYRDFEIGETFSAGVWVSNLDHEGGRTVWQRIAVWDNDSYTNGDSVTIAPGETKLVKYEGFSPTADSSWVQPRLHGALEEGYRWAARDFMFNRGPKLLDYFDGSTPPERAWVDFQPRNVSGIKRIWPRSVTPPPSGTHYAWLGEPHASESVKLDTDGNEIARNLVENPHFERVPNDLTTPYGSMSIRDSKLNSISTRKSSSSRLEKRITLNEPGEYTWTVYALFPDSVTQVSYQLPVGVSHPITNLEVHGGWNRYSITFTVTEPGDKRLRLYFSNINVGEQITVDWELLTPGTLTDYFDGDTPSDRANDLWYNTQGVPHEWVNGQGWVEL